MKNKKWIRMFSAPVSTFSCRESRLWRPRIFAVLIATLIMMGGFSMTAYAGGGEETETIPEDTVVAETETTSEPCALTPEGNLTLVDDISGETSGDKQFITVITRNDNYFYIIIDRAKDGENTVHFLNQVDEADLTAILEELGATPVQPVTQAPEPEPITEPETEPEQEKSSGAGGIVVVILILALGGGGAFYYFKVMKPKQTVKGGDNLDDFDFEDDEYEEMELEVFEDEPDSE